MLRLPLALALVGAVPLAGCEVETERENPDGTTTTERTEIGVADEVEENAREALGDAEDGLDRAGEGLRNAAGEAGDAAQDGARDAGDAIRDGAQNVEDAVDRDVDLGDDAENQ